MGWQASWAEDEDVQLIIIPKKPQKPLRPQLQNDHENNDDEAQESKELNNDSGNKDSTSENEYENFHRNSKNAELNSFKLSKNSEDSKNSDDSRKDFKNFWQRYSQTYYKRFARKAKSTNDDATLILQRVAPEDDGRWSVKK